MKKIILTLASLMILTGAHSQNFTLTMDGFLITKDPSTNFLVVEFPGQSTEDLYNASYLYLRTLAGEQGQTLTTEQNSSITVSGKSTAGAVKTGRDYAHIYIYEYLIKVQFREGRIRIDIPQVEFPSPSLMDHTRKMALKGGGRLTDSIFSDSGRLKELETRNKIENDINEIINGIILACDPSTANEEEVSPEEDTMDDDNW